MGTKRDTPRLLTRRETAEILRRCPRTVQRYEQAGLLRPVRVGENGRPLYRLENVDALVGGGS